MTKQTSIRCPNCGGYDSRAVYDQAYLKALNAQTTLGSVVGTWFSNIVIALVVWLIASLPHAVASNMARDWLNSPQGSWLVWAYLPITLAIFLFYASRIWRATVQYASAKVAMAKYPQPVFDGYACDLCKFRWHEGDSLPSDQTPKAKLTLMTQDDAEKRRAMSRDGVCAECGTPTQQRCSLCHLRFCSAHLHKKAVQYQRNDEDTGAPYVWTEEKLCCADCGNELIV